MATGQPDFIGNVTANYRMHRRLRSHGSQPEEDQPGTYRIKHYNTQKYLAVQKSTLKERRIQSRVSCLGKAINKLIWIRMRYFL